MPTATDTPLTAYFAANPTFTRSASLQDSTAGEGYVVTDLTRSSFDRMIAGLARGSTARAWAIIGPYGTGKTSFALQLSSLLRHPIDSLARRRFQEAADGVWGRALATIPSLESQGFLVVPVVGSREPLGPSLLRALILSLSRLPAATGALVLDARARAEAALAEAARSGGFPASQVEALLQQAAAAAAASGCLGLLIIVDEMGKLLEWTALNPAQGGIYLLQVLAELAARSGDNPIGIATIMHRSFETYASRLSAAQRAEWSKVQGRFETIGFLERTDALLQLVGAAIAHRDIPSPMRDCIVTQVEQARGLGLLPR